MIDLLRLRNFSESHCTNGVAKISSVLMVWGSIQLLAVVPRYVLCLVPVLVSLALPFLCPFLQCEESFVSSQRQFSFTTTSLQPFPAIQCIQHSQTTNNIQGQFNKHRLRLRKPIYHVAVHYFQVAPSTATRFTTIFLP